MTRGGKPRSSRGDRAAGQRNPFDQVFADAAGLLETDDPVEAEFFASSIAALPGLAETRDGLEEALAVAFAQEARRRATPAALALLLALAQVAPARWRPIAGKAADELLAQRVGPPPWAGSIGTASFAGAWLGVEPLGDQEVVFVSFQHRGQSPHALQLLIDHNVSGIIKDAQLVPEVAEILERWREGMPEMEFRQLSAGETATRVAQALEQSDAPWLEPPWTDDFRALRALVAARLELLPEPEPAQDPEPMPDELRAALIGEFLASPEGAGARGRDAERVVAAIVDCRADYLHDGDPLRWSPIVVEMLADMYVRKMDPEPEDLDRLPGLLRAWVRYAGRRRGLAPELVTETLEAVVRVEAELDQEEDPEAVPDDAEVEEFLAALDAEESQALELMRDALPEIRAAAPPPELKAAASRLRRELPRSAHLRSVRRAAGWKRRLPADDRELWLGTVGGLLAMHDDAGLDAEDESTLMALETADWVGAVVGLVRAGVDADASPAALVRYIDRCPEVDGEVDPDDVELIEYAFELVLPAWEAAGAVTADGRLTNLGRWGLPRALAWAWGHEFD
jgi:hypothetical protein